MRPTIVATGGELLSGRTLDSNGAFMARRLGLSGFQIVRHVVVGDAPGVLYEELAGAGAESDLIVMSGGLGPTADDLTREALAAATGKELVRDEASLEHIRQLFESRGRSMPSRNVVQADFPAGSQPISNPHGTAPGVELSVERDGRQPSVLFALPGVPAEMFEMWEATVAPRIVQLQPQPREIGRASGRERV